MGINFSFGQTGYSIDTFAPIQMDIPCIEAQYDLRVGSRDYALFGDVMKLQLFLYQNEIMYHPPTGYFGPITQSSLARYQSLRNIAPTGLFDFATRNALAKETCGGVSRLTPPSNYQPVSYQQSNPNNTVDLSNLFGNSGTPNNQPSSFNVSGSIFSQ